MDDNSSAAPSPVSWNGRIAVESLFDELPITAEARNGAVDLTDGLIRRLLLAEESLPFPPPFLPFLATG